jgi:hypothetical protein
MDARRVGFVTNDDGTVGCSPDALVGDDAGIEVKCPALQTHIKYMRQNSLFSGEYATQVQGSMWVCDRPRWYLLSYNPEVPPVLLIVKRNEEYIEKLSAAVGAFVGDLRAARETLGNEGLKPRKPRSVEVCPHGVDLRVCRECN